ncbi:flagellar hook-length control protein FliK [Methylobacter sp. S3L5C]|uniref:flagellar hook-length control protein FliK n=1 Tax=Methylobacter sp. S3L5C TaxID=2839024 RepID=UPI001FABB558|nr:flagellar hook-length control protein FliK [Methylobacter sp. S3L5C]UOA09032.1 flagellar hook-length control protein FliK [Methylobacter sp. S3L5C]
MNIILSPSITSTLPSSLQDSSEVNNPADNMAFNNLLQKEIFSHREPTNKAAKTQSSVNAEQDPDPLAVTATNTTSENLLALIMNARPSPAPLDATQANPDTTTTQQPAATIKLAGSDPLNTIVREPAKNAAMQPEPSSLSSQYTNATSTPVALSNTEPASTAKPTLSKSLNTSIEPPAKHNIIVPESLAVDHQDANATLNQVIKGPVKESVISPEFLPTANNQHSDITFFPATLSTMPSTFTIKPATSDTLNKAIKQPAKDTVILPQPLSMSRQDTNTPSIPTTLNAIEPELPANFSRQEDFSSALQIQLSPAIPATTYSSTNIINVAPTSATYDISPAFDSPNWDKTINQQVIWMMQNKLQTASLTINPPHLGPIQVMMQIDNQLATVQFVSAQPEVREALQNALPLLTDMLKQSGIQLGHADVSSQNKHSESRQSVNSSKTNKNSVDTSVIDPALNAQQTNNAGQGLINLIV